MGSQSFRIISCVCSCRRNYLLLYLMMIRFTCGKFTNCLSAKYAICFYEHFYIDCQVFFRYGYCDTFFLPIRLSPHWLLLKSVFFLRLVKFYQYIFCAFKGIRNPLKDC